LQLRLWAFLVLLLASGIPAVGSTYAQNNDDDITLDNVTDLADSATEGLADNTRDNLADSATEGLADNTRDNLADSATEGLADNTRDNLADSATEGLVENATEGLVENATEGLVENATEGLVENATEGLVDDLPFVNDTETSSVNATSIVINEVELNAQGSDVGQEWIELYNPTIELYNPTIELYNPTNVETNISGFEIRTSFKSATVELPEDAEIDANGTYIFELDGQTLSDTAESLVLVNASGEEIDRTPPLVDKNNDDRTWQRIPDGYNEWQFAAGTRDELNDPDRQLSPTYTARTGSAAHCMGAAGCTEGTVRRIVDGDTLYVMVNSTVYKVDLALVSAPSSNERGFSESRSFTQSLCFGSSVLIDQDDKLLTSQDSIIAVVYCESTNLNSELLNNGYATINTEQCGTSEFAGQPWAKDHGC
jgi:endonuclease YncB( thermonuclease family)